MTAKVDFFKEDVKLVVDNATQAGLTAVALRVEERAKVNITRNDQVDTGAMLNGVYAAWRGGGNYDQNAANALSRTAFGEIVNEAPLPAGDDPAALVAGAMEYTLWQELQKAFLYPALVEVAAEAPALIAAEAKAFF